MFVSKFHESENPVESIRVILWYHITIRYEIYLGAQLLVATNFHFIKKFPAGCTYHNHFLYQVVTFIKDVS